MESQNCKLIKSQNLIYSIILKDGEISRTSNQSYESSWQCGNLFHLSKLVQILPKWKSENITFTRSSLLCYSIASKKAQKHSQLAEFYSYICLKKPHAQKSQNKRRVLMFCNARSTILTQPIKQLTLVQNKQNESSESIMATALKSLPNKITEAFHNVYITVA